MVPAGGSRTIRLTLAYDGADFHGWQTQPGLRTVQEEIEGVLRRLVRHPVALVGASRTDAGVHARGQVAHFVTDCLIPTDRLGRALADRLPQDIALVRAEEAAPGFHATRDARAKLYRYRIFASKRRPTEELVQRYVWHVWHPLEMERLRDAARRWIGRHDFAGFATKGSPRQTTVRTIFRCEISREYDEIRIDVEGDGFLYNQVRNMVGTLYEIGRGHWPAERIDRILASKDRRDAGTTAPAQGLCLHWVRYSSDGGESQA